MIYSFWNLIMYCENIAHRMKIIFSNNYKFIKTLPVSSFFHIVIFTYYEEPVLMNHRTYQNLHDHDIYDAYLNHLA